MKIYRVSLIKNEVKAENAPAKPAALGDQGLTSRIIDDEISPTI